MHILITGCSSGIGFDAACALKQRGHHVIATCRKPADVERMQQLGFDSVSLDVNDLHSITEGFHQALDLTGGRLDVLINNAGYGQAGALEDVPEGALLAQFQTNVLGLMALTRLAIPLMRRQKFGRIINISSLLGFVSMPFRGAYNASKYAVEGLSDTLRLELHDSGIKVITIEPGPIDSQFRDHAVDLSMQCIDVEHSHFRTQYQHMLTDYKAQKSESWFTQKPEAVIKKLIHAIESRRPKPKYLVTFPAYLFMILKRVLSVRGLDWVMRKIAKHEL